MTTDKMNKAGFMYLAFTGGNPFYFNVANIAAIEVYQPQNSDKKKVRVYLTNGKLLSDIVGKDFSEDYFMEKLEACLDEQGRYMQAIAAGTCGGELKYENGFRRFYMKDLLK